MLVHGDTISGPIFYTDHKGANEIRDAIIDGEKCWAIATKLSNNAKDDVTLDDMSQKEIGRWKTKTAVAVGLVVIVTTVFIYREIKR